MRIAEFRLERFFARYEFAVKHLLGSSDAETFDAHELLALADDESRALWRSIRLGYTETAGHPVLRARIAALYKGIAPDDVLVCSGAEEAIFIFSQAALGETDHAIVVWPAYQSLYETARAAGASVDLLRLRHQNGWAVDPDEVASLIRPNTKCLVLNAPHNPTGSLPDVPTLRALAALCEARGIRLVVDEVYRFAEIDEHDRLPAACEAARDGVSIGGLAEPFGLAGTRIGWIASHDRDLLARMVRVKDYLTICNAAPSELLAIACLSAASKVLARNRAIGLSNLALLDDFFARRRDRFAWVRPRAWLIGFPKLLGDERVDGFCDRLVRESGVMLVPESVFDHTGNHFRIGFGRSDMPQALALLEAFLDR